MEQTTLQQRIEERAAWNLRNHLLTAYQKQCEIVSLIGKDNFPEILDVREMYASRYRKEDIKFGNVKTEEIFNSMLPNFIKNETDELLKKIDEIDYLLSEKSLHQEEY